MKGEQDSSNHRKTGESLNKHNKNEYDMARRIKIGGKYYIIREKSTSAGQKGTIQGKWKPLRKKRRKGIFDFLR